MCLTLLLATRNPRKAADFSKKTEVPPEIHARQLMLKKPKRKIFLRKNWGWFFPSLISNPYTNLCSYIFFPPRKIAY